MSNEFARPAYLIRVMPAEELQTTNSTLPTTRGRDFLLRVIIIANGELSHPQMDAEHIQPEDILLAADGGARHCLALGFVPKEVIGDFDSLSKDELRRLQDAGAELHQYPAHKDETDLELALRRALEFKLDEIIIIGALGDRWDMTFANLLLIAHADFGAQSIRIVDGTQTLSILRGGQQLRIQGQVGHTVSLVPLLGDAIGVTTQGLEYPLQDEILHFGIPRGTSNVMRREQISIQLESGLLLIVHISEMNDLSEN
jgi:thiamine pyrophosphokinase